VIATDTTEQKKAEQNLKKSEARLKRIAKNLPEFVVEIGLDGTVLYVNHTVEGVSPDEVLGTSAFEWVELKDRVSYKKCFEKAVAGEREEIELTSKGPNNTQSTYHLRLTPIYEEGHIISVLQTATDVTEKRLLKEKVAKLTKKIPFTKKESLVFYGLVKYPYLTDNELSQKINIQRSTITAIKNKLVKQEFYKTYAVPNFQALGCELLVFMHGKIPSSQKEGVEMEEKEIVNAVINTPEIVFSASNKETFFAIMIFKNYTTYRSAMDGLLKKYDQLLGKKPDIDFFPFDINLSYKFMEFSTTLKRLLNVDVQDETTPPIKISKKHPLSKMEQLIFYALIRYPSMPDSQLALKLNISRQKLSRVKKNLISPGLLTIARIPDPKKLGCELMTYVHGKKTGAYESQHSSSFVCLANMTENACVYLFDRYSEYEAEMLDLKKMSVSITSHNLSLENLSMYRTNFASLVKKVFGLDVDF